MDKILNAGVAVYLKLQASKLQRRITQSNNKNPNKRPLVAGLEGQELLEYIVAHLEEREPFYDRADMEVNADKVNSAMLDRIKEMYEDWASSD
jgi:shikimate kinase